MKGKSNSDIMQFVSKKFYFIHLLILDIILNKSYHFRFFALYKGLLPKVLRLGPGGAIMLLVYENVYELLKETYPD